MPDYKKLYFQLFGAIAETMEGLETLKQELEKATNETEEQVIEAEDRLRLLGNTEISKEK